MHVFAHNTILTADDNNRQTGQDNEPINYFVDLLPKLLASSENANNSLGAIEFIQEEGETVFVPGNS